MRAWLVLQIPRAVARDDQTWGNAIEIRAKRSDVVAGRFGCND